MDSGLVLNVPWDKLVRRPLVVPPPPTLPQEVEDALRRFRLRVLFLPAITEDDYPDSFVKLEWGGWYEDVDDMVRQSLLGGWMAIEPIAKPSYHTSGGYGIGDADPMARALGIETRLEQSWDAIETRHLPKAAELLGVSPGAVHLLSVEQLNLTGNLFNWLREERGEDLPDLGSTNLWEWCENPCHSGCRLANGFAGHGGLAAVGADWPNCIHFGFRVAVEL